MDNLHPDTMAKAALGELDSRIRNAGPFTEWYVYYRTGEVKIDRDGGEDWQLATNQRVPLMDRNQTYNWLRDVLRRTPYLPAE